jgi:hypothetical protein
MRPEERDPAYLWDAREAARALDPIFKARMFAPVEA